MLRACLSGEPSCTGIAPCPACDKAMLTQVLPKAMIAAGFNGSAQIAQAFFTGYKLAHERLLTSLAAQFMATEPPPAAPAETLPAPPEPTASAVEPIAPVPVPEALTESELSTMGTIEDYVEDEPETAEESSPPRRTLSPKAARAAARKARKLKKKRAGLTTQSSEEKKEDTHHGKEEHGDDGDRDDHGPDQRGDG